MVKFNMRGENMVVYADILFVVNLIVDFFLLKVTLKIIKIKPKGWRLVLASVLGGLFSFYIFLPKSPFLVELSVHVIMNAVMMLLCVGFKSAKFFLRSVIVNFAVTCIYGGSMIAFWQICRPRGMVINNSVVYFNISPIVLIVCTVTGYFLYILSAKIFTVSSRNAQRCSVTFYALGNSTGAAAIIDTGNSINDIMTDSEIIIADKSVALALFGTLDLSADPFLATRYRTIPCSTVSGAGILEGFRCDRCEIYLKDKTIRLDNPVLAVSETAIKEDYSVILNPKILDIEGVKNENVKAVFK